MVGYFQNHYGDVMSAKTKTRPGAQQQKLDLRSVKKKDLFKKKDATSKSIVTKSPRKTQVKDEPAIKRVEKKSEFARQFFNGAHSISLSIVLTKEDLELLRLFDHNRDYGPCIGKPFLLCIISMTTLLGTKIGGVEIKRDLHIIDFNGRQLMEEVSSRLMLYIYE